MSHIIPFLAAVSILAAFYFGIVAFYRLHKFDAAVSNMRHEREERARMRWIARRFKVWRRAAATR